MSATGRSYVPPHSKPSGISRWALFWSSMSKNIVKWNLSPQRHSIAEKPTSLRFGGRTIAWRHRWVLVNEISHKTEHTVFQQWILSPLEEIKDWIAYRSFYFQELQISVSQNKENCLNKRHCSPKKAQRQNSKLVIEQRRKNMLPHYPQPLRNNFFLLINFLYKEIYSHSLLCK